MGFHKPYRLKRMGNNPESYTHPIAHIAIIMGAILLIIPLTAIALLASTSILIWP